MQDKSQVTRRGFMKKAALAAAIPMFVNSKAFGANDRITMGCIGTGGRGRDDMSEFLKFKQVQVVAVCDVVADHRGKAKGVVDKRYNSKDGKTYTDFREITTRKDIEAVMIATPDHWHAGISIEAMKHGKDVFCEKPETLTIKQGRAMVKAARRYARVFSGGSQRTWGDYNWFHKIVRGGAIGEVKEAWVSNIGGPSGPCHLPPEKTPEGVDWEMWLGPAPKRPFHRQLIKSLGWYPFRDYSGGGMTGWGTHSFGGAMFALNLHMTGPTEITPPDGKDVKYLTYKFANGVKIYHEGGWDKSGQLCFKGSEGKIPGPNGTRKMRPPNIHIPNYKGSGGLIGDFLHCVRTRQKPFRDIEVAHRTATLAHLGNIAYWLKKPLKWDPVKEEIIGDAEASRWLDRAAREPWGLW